jgi:hypothetical protein
MYLGKSLRVEIVIVLMILCSTFKEEEVGR